MVGYQERFTQQGLSVAMGDLSGEIAVGAGDKFLHGFKVGQDLFHAFVPGFVAGRRFGFGPVFIRPLRRFVFGGAAEFKNVPLGNADVLQQLPRCMRASFRLAVAQTFRKILERFAQIDMRFSLG